MVYRFAAWLSLAALLVLSVVPAVDRPVVVSAHDLEHGMAFGIAGALWYKAYPRSLGAALLLLVGFTAAIEIIQIFVPTRHARLSDFVVDALAISAGALLAYGIRAALQRQIAGSGTSG